MTEAADKRAASDADSDLVFEADLEAAPEKVWRALSTPEIREAWLGEPEAGPAEVRRSEPPSRLDLVWPTRDGDTLVSFQIEPAEDGGAHLTIVHRMTARILPFPTHRIRMISGWRMAA